MYDQYKNSKTVVPIKILWRPHIYYVLLFRRKKKNVVRFLMGQKHRSWHAFFTLF